VLISARHLVDRFRQRKRRAEDLAELARELAKLPSPSKAPAELVEIANRLRQLRERLAEALGEVESCSHCAKGHPFPFGRWEGGHCCGGRTEQLFTRDELWALKLSGTSMRSLRTPVSDLAGCAFRGPTGCSLEPRHRPNLCVRYLCRDLEGELRRRGDKPEIEALARELGATFERFAAMRRHYADEALLFEALGDAFQFSCPETGS
jgi:hypothetical protein